MSKNLSIYSCSNCRKITNTVEDLFFVEESSQNGFCSEACIEKFYLPVVKYLEENDQKVKDLHGCSLKNNYENESVLEQTLLSPDHIFENRNDLGQKIYHFLKQIDSNNFSVILCHLYKGEPSFIYLFSLTTKKEVFEYYQVGEAVSYEIIQESKEKISNEVRETLERKKSMMLAEILQHRSDDDIPLDQFFDYQQYDGQTLDYPDEIYEDTDNEGDLLITYVKSFFLPKNSFYHFVFGLKSNKSSEVIPFVSCPTNNKDFYRNFTNGTIVSKSLKN